MRNYSFLAKMTLFGCLLCTLPVLFVGFFSYWQSSQVIQKQASRSQSQMLAQMNANVEQILLAIYHSLNQLSDSTVVQKMMSEPFDPSDYKLYNDLRKEISNTESSYTKVEDVVLIDFQHNWMVKNSGIYTFDRYLHYRQISNLIMLPNTFNWVLNPSIWFYSEETANSVPCAYTISLVKKLPAQSPDKNGLAFANIPTCSLTEMVKYSPGESESIMIIDDLNRILYHSNPSMIGKYASDSGFVTNPLDLKEPTGQYRMELKDETYTVTYRRSSFNNWLYVSAISIDSLTKEAKQIERFTIVISLAIVVVFALIARFGSRRMYSPIRNLVMQIGGIVPRQREGKGNEFDLISDKLQELFRSKSQLEKEAYTHIQQALTLFIMKMFQGSLRRKDLEEKLELFGFGDKVAGWKQMTVITLQIDTLDNTRYSKEDLELLQFAVNNIAEELIPADVRFPSLTIDQTTVVLIGSSDTEQQEFNAYVAAIAESIQRTVEQLLKLKLSIGISLPFSDPKNASVAYREGLEALRHRFHLGEGVIIPYAHLNEGKHRKQFSYPGLTETELLDAIVLTDEDKARGLLKFFMQQVLKEDLTPQEYQIPMFRLLNSLLVFVQQSGVTMGQLGAREGSFYEELNKLSFAAEIEEWFWAKLIRPLIGIFQDRNNSQYQNISEKMIEMISKHYDTDLTIEQCAAKLHYNANYLSGVFRKETGMTFSEYLSNYRLNMAKKWLAETDMTVKEIAERLQYMNSQNFIRSFRKQEGITPGQYRTNHQKIAT
ncbi:helix-turn-helix domain-containing protein [Paenibacillus chartarius]|uniref:Helix-turn-helix domain-containing protein n=1 Tax=Paenibacillus chartarius TaxID=747481 RepID=A0ABV6DPQ6_9BACL